MAGTLATVVAEAIGAGMLTAVDEAALVRRDESTVSRARRQVDHPAGPAQLLLDLDRGRHVDACAVADLTEMGLYGRGGITAAGREVMARQVVTVGLRNQYVVAPQDEVLAWWRRRRPASRPSSGGSGSVPDGWSKRQWQALRAVARGEAPNPVMGRLLRERGALTRKGGLTAAARRLLAERGIEVRS